jgi:hypothetical protein
MTITRQGYHRVVGNIAALDQPDALELREGRKAHDGVVCQVRATPQVDIPYSVATVHQALDRLIRNLTTVPEMHIMKVLTKPGNGMDSYIGDVSALGQN